MRYLGNKRHLLTEIETAARSIGFTKGTVCDLFAGTARVGRHFRSLGNRVLATDLMACSYISQKVFLELTGPPSFARLKATLDLPSPVSTSRVKDAQPADPTAWLPTREILAYLESCSPCSGLLTRQYSPTGEADRRYLTSVNAGRIDAMLMSLRDWRLSELVTEEETALLLATIIDATDRVANVSGTYGAFLKNWQTSAEGDVSLRLPAVVQGPVGEANHRDALDWIEEVEADLLYIDPPYNQRQYAANYHLLEVVARLPFESDLPSFESSIYGKTGLIPWRHRASKLCSRRGDECRSAFSTILERTRIPRVVISYNEEGIIQREEFEEMLAEFSGVARSQLGMVLQEIPYRRFRSDADGRVSSRGSGRKYRELPGRGRDEVHEWLFSVAKQPTVGR